jgi:hypothetical protein
VQPIYSYATKRTERTARPREKDTSEYLLPEIGLTVTDCHHSVTANIESHRINPNIIENRLFGNQKTVVILRG